MFWSLDDSNHGGPARAASGPLSEYLRGQVRGRLLLALDFATLGAYELAHQEAATDVTAIDAAPESVHHRGPVTRERPQRVFLFAKVAGPACSHYSPREEPACDPARETSLRRSRLGHRSRRGGSAVVPAQPCTW